MGKFLDAFFAYSLVASTIALILVHKIFPDPNENNETNSESPSTTRTTSTKLMDEKKAKAYYLRGKAQQMLGNHREASEDFERAIRLHDQWGERRNFPQENVDIRALTQETLGNYNGASTDLFSQTRKQPDNFLSITFKR